MLLVADRRDNRLQRQLARCGYQVLSSYTGDHAVAICASNPVSAVVLDQKIFVEVDGWSLAQSLKLVRRNMCIILSLHGRPVSLKTPKGVDAIVDANRPEDIALALDELTQRTCREK